MNSCKIIIASIISVVGMMGCTPVMEEQPVTTAPEENDVRGTELSFIVEEKGLEGTKAMAERTSITAFNCMVLKPDNSAMVNNVTTTKNGNIETLSGKYWPASGTLSFFGVLPAVTMTNTGGTVTFPVGSSSSKLTGTEDYVFASRRGVSNATSPVNLTFNHIMSNISQFQATGATAGAVTRVTSITVAHPKYGTYSCSAGGDSWTNLGANENTSLSTSFVSTSYPSGKDQIVGTETGVATNGMSLIPGSYSVRIQYSVTAGSITRNYDKSGTITLAAGKKNNISVSLTNDLKALNISTSVVPWVTGNSATAWVEDFKPAKGYSVNLYDGEWVKTANTLTTNASEYDGIYKNVNTSTVKSYKRMSITFTGYEVFSFRVFAAYTGNVARAVYVSSEDNDLFSKLPDISSATWSNVRAANNNVDGYYGTSSYFAASYQDILAAYKIYAFTDLDPSQTYTVQILAFNTGGNYNGLDATVIIPKEQTLPDPLYTPDYGVRDYIGSWTKPAGKNFTHAYSTPSEYDKEYEVYVQDMWLTISGYSTFSCYVYGNSEAVGSVYLYDSYGNALLKRVDLNTSNFPPLSNYNASQSNLGCYQKVEFTGLNPFLSYRIRLNTAGYDGAGMVLLME